jgi:very-short-patch-repair endonuclease
MTRQEVKLWQRLRELRAIGHHFRRQSPLAPYIVDFECRHSRVIVEVDGHQHGYDENRKRDAMRDNALMARGYRILRFSNGDVDRELDGVMEAISLALASPHPARASRSPPSPRGGGMRPPMLHHCFNSKRSWQP